MDSTRSRRFIITTWEGGGSVGPTLTVARKLLAAGHEVRLMSDACNRPECEATGAEFVPWTRAPSRTDKSRESELLTDWKAHDLAGVLDCLFGAITIGPALAYARDIIAELERRPADLVVTNELLFGVPLGCEAAGQDFALLACNTLAFPIEGAPPSGPLAGKPLSAEQDQARQAMLAALGEVFAGQLPALNVARAELGLPALANLFEQLRPARKTLIAISRKFDFGPESDPPGFAYVGPQLDDLPWAEAWQAPWPQNDDRPLVLVSFSTTFQNHQAVLQRVIDALALLPVRALVTLGPTIAPAELDAAANVHLVVSAPHNVVMREAQLVVTHGGHGTVARGMVHRLPMLVIPHGRDQDGNAERIVAHGAGLMLSPDAGTGAISAALERLLAEPGFAEGARRLGGAVAREASESPVVTELEALCRCREFA